jgi:hypothetical protein
MLYFSSLPCSCLDTIFFLFNFRSMIVETKAKSVPMGFLDPELISLAIINSDKSYVVGYVTKVLQIC